MHSIPYGFRLFHFVNLVELIEYHRNIENLIKYLKQEYGLNEIFGGFRTKSIIFSKTINKNDILCDIGETLNEDIDEIIVNAKIRNISTSDIIHFYEINKEFKNSYMKEIF